MGLNAKKFAAIAIVAGGLSATALAGEADEPTADNGYKAGQEAPSLGDFWKNLKKDAAGLGNAVSGAADKAVDAATGSEKPAGPEDMSKSHNPNSYFPSGEPIPMARPVREQSLVDQAKAAANGITAPTVKTPSIDDAKKAVDGFAKKIGGFFGLDKSN